MNKIGKNERKVYIYEEIIKFVAYYVVCYGVFNWVVVIISHLDRVAEKEIVNIIFRYSLLPFSLRRVFKQCKYKENW